MRAEASESLPAAKGSHGPSAPPAPLAKRLKRYARYLAVRAALRAVALLPARWAGSLGELFGHLGWHLARSERRKALESLARAFPHLSGDELWDICLHTFRHLGRCAFELACIDQLDAEIDQWVEWPQGDRQLLEAVLARRKGVVFVSGHLGNWELLARRVALAGYPCQTIAKETTDARLTALIERFRASAGLKSIWRGQPGAAKQMLRALKAGEILGLLIDQDTRVQSIFVPFFGHLAATPRAAADLALRTGAAVVVGFCRRLSPGRYSLSMEEVALPEGEDRQAAARALTATLTEQIERAIRLAPEQWVWMHRRWKTRPSPRGP